MNLPNTYRNWISLSGTVIAICGFLAFFLLLLITSISGSEAVYLGLLIFLVTPFFIIGGLLLIPIGMRIERKKLKGDIDVIWLQEGIENEKAKQLALENNIVFIQDKCIYKEYINNF